VYWFAQIVGLEFIEAHWLAADGAWHSGETFFQLGAASK
jgi:hypothetical protein